MILEATDLRKTYDRGGRSVAALAGMSMRVQKGGVHGLVGPNGAGKSTLLRVILGLIRADGGSCRLFGAPAGDPAAMRRVGSLIESPRIYPFMTGRAALGVLARTSGVSLSAIPALLERVDLTAAADRKVDTYSLGMKQRLGVAAALLGGPDLLILDEPLNGLDPAGIRQMRELVASLAAEGATVLISSHVLSEVERVCDSVTIIQAGRAVSEGRLAEALSGERILRIEAEPLEAALAIAGPGAAIDGKALRVRMERADAPDLIARLTAGGVRVFEARWEGRDLEALYLETTAPRALQGSPQ